MHPWQWRTIVSTEHDALRGIVGGPFQSVIIGQKAPCMSSLCGQWSVALGHHRPECSLCVLSDSQEEFNLFFQWDSCETLFEVCLWKCVCFCWMALEPNMKIQINSHHVKEALAHTSIYLHKLYATTIC